MTSEERRQEYPELWDCIRSIKSEQKLQTVQLNAVEKAVAEINATISVRCAGRQETVELSLEMLSGVDKAQAKHLDALDIKTKEQDESIRSLELSRAKIVGIVISVAAMSSLISSIIGLAFGGGG